LWRRSGSRLLRRDRKRGGDHRRGRYASVAGGRRDREVTPGDEFGNGGLCAGAQGPVLLGDGADHAALEAKEERVLLRLRHQLGKLDLLVLDELGYVSASKAGAELLFDVIAAAYERYSLVVMTNLAFENWT
jgi:hypothetical protein